MVKGPGIVLLDGSIEEKDFGDDYEEKEGKEWQEQDEKEEVQVKVEDEEPNEENVV